MYFTLQCLHVNTDIFKSSVYKNKCHNQLFYFNLIKVEFNCIIIKRISIRFKNK